MLFRSDPESGESRGGINLFEDRFAPLLEGGPWVLVERTVRSQPIDADVDSAPATEVRFRFDDLEPLA